MTGKPRQEFNSSKCIMLHRMTKSLTWPFFPPFPSHSSPPLLSLWHGPCLPPSSFELYTPYCFCALSPLKYSLRRLCTSCTSSRALHLVLPCILCYPIHRSRMWHSRVVHDLIRTITRLPFNLNKSPHAASLSRVHVRHHCRHDVCVVYFAIFWSGVLGYQHFGPIFELNVRVWESRLRLQL